jgi:hypothetical protein
VVKGPWHLGVSRKVAAQADAALQASQKTWALDAELCMAQRLGGDTLQARKATKELALTEDDGGHESHRQLFHHLGAQVGDDAVETVIPLPEQGHMAAIRQQPVPSDDSLHARACRV